MCRDLLFGTDVGILRVRTAGPPRQTFVPPAAGWQLLVCRSLLLAQGIALDRRYECIEVATVALRSPGLASRIGSYDGAVGSPGISDARARVVKRVGFDMHAIDGHACLQSLRQITVNWVANNEL